MNDAGTFEVCYDGSGGGWRGDARHWRKHLRDHDFQPLEATVGGVLLALWLRVPLWLVR